MTRDEWKNILKLDGGRDFREKQFEGAAAVDDICIRADVRVPASLLLEAPTGTSTSAPSNSFNIPCWTLSPETSLEWEFFFLAILSISSMNMMPVSALSTSLSAAARSFDTTDSISSPI